MILPPLKTAKPTPKGWAFFLVAGTPGRRRRAHKRKGMLPKKHPLSSLFGEKTDGG